MAKTRLWMFRLQTSSRVAGKDIRPSIDMTAVSPTLIMDVPISSPSRIAGHERSIAMLDCKARFGRVKRLFTPDTDR